MACTGSLYRAKDVLVHRLDRIPPVTILSFFLLLLDRLHGDGGAPAEL